MDLDTLLRDTASVADPTANDLRLAGPRWTPPRRSAHDGWPGSAERRGAGLV